MSQMKSGKDADGNDLTSATSSAPAADDLNNSVDNVVGVAD